MNKQFFINMIICVLLFTGCQKDVDQFNPSGNAATFNADIFGVVLDPDKKPIEGAKVSFDGNVTYSDKYGVYKFDNSKVKSTHNFFTITKDGYFEGCKTFRTDRDHGMQFKSVLVPKNFDLTFSASTGGNIEKGNVTLDFEPNSIVYDDDNTDYTGDVKVAVHYLDPLAWSSFDIMPGDLSSINAGNEVGTLLSYGMVYVELQATNGEKLQIKKDKTVKMSAVVSQDLLANAKSEIPMWYFDYKTGLWVEEGIGQLVGNVYTASVSHFSCWNYDYNFPSIILSGRVVDKNGNPMPNVHVWVSPVGEYLGGHGNTHIDGTFSGRVPKDKELEIKLFFNSSNCINKWNAPDQIINIGVISADKNIGDIVFDALELRSLHISGTFTDCDGQKVEDGFLQIDNVLFPFIGGTIDMNIVVCSANSIEIVVIDRVKLMASTPIITTFESELFLGNVIVCGNQPEFISYNSDTDAISGVILDYISHGIDNSDISYIQGFGRDSSFVNLRFELPLGIKTFPVGSYPIVDGTFISLSEQFNWARFPIFESGTINITTPGVNLGDEINGNYSIKMKKEQGIDIYEFKGNFRVKL